MLTEINRAGQRLHTAVFVLKAVVIRLSLMCIIRPVFSESLLGLGVSSGEFGDWVKSYQNGVSHNMGRFARDSLLFIIMFMSIDYDSIL